MASDQAASKCSERENETREYLEKHRILDLFNNFTSQLMFHRPDEPKTFLIDTLEELQKSKESKIDYPCLFDDSNIHSVFGMLDPTNTGFVTTQQYKEALTTLGIKKFDEHPEGAEDNKITLEIFLNEAKLGLIRASSTFAE